jgi:rRNA maturation protein Nop10
MKIILTENQLNNLLLEYVVAPFEDLNDPYDPNDEYPEYRYMFKFELGGLTYDVKLLKSDGERAYDISFDYEGGNENKGAGKDIEHFNSVMYTVINIMEYAAKKYKIKTIEFEGIYSDKPERKVNGRPQEPLRSRYYRRFLQQKYPADAIHVEKYRTYVDMTKIFPDVFYTEKKSRVNVLFNLIEQTTGNSFSLPQKKSFLGSWYNNDNNFTISIKDLEPIKGNVPITIHVEVDTNGYIFYVETENYSQETDVYTFRELCQELVDSIRDAIKS